MNNIKNYIKNAGYKGDFSEFDVILVKPLAKVNVIKANRPKDDTANQTHIHFTGEEMYEFFDQEEIDRATMGTKDEKIEVRFLGKNIYELEQRRLRIKGIAVEQGKLLKDDEEIQQDIIGETVKKISVRKTGSKQVQISKVAMDDIHFKIYRQTLFIDDLMVILRYKNSKNKKYLFLGIPKEDFDYEGNKGKYINLNSGDDKKQKEQSDKEKTNVKRERELKEVTSESIATTIFREDVDEEFDPDELKENLEMKKAKLKERTELHQACVKNLAIFLERNGFKLYESVIDCLAIKNSSVMIFEVKTIIKDNEKDMRKQVRKALSQLLFYKHFRIPTEEEEIDVKLVAVFDNEIKKKYVKFLKEYNIDSWIVDISGNIKGY
ncbi:MAG: hypothetical protein ACRC41_01220 [Sarcina sp.]